MESLARHPQRSHLPLVSSSDLRKLYGTGAKHQFPLTNIIDKTYVVISRRQAIFHFADRLAWRFLSWDSGNTMLISHAVLFLYWRQNRPLEFVNADVPPRWISFPGISNVITSL